MELTEDAYESLIKAYKLIPSNPDYQERAAIALLKTGKREEALELAEKIISSSQSNPRAWVVMSQLQPEISVPEEVSDQRIFKILMVSFWASQDSLMPIIDFSPLFKKDSEKRVLPSDRINRSELFYWFYLAQFVFFDFLTSNVKIHSIKKNDLLTNADPLKYAAQIYEAILQRIDQTELKEHSTLRLCQFDYLICKYFLTTDRSYVHRAYQIFTSDGLDPLPFKQLAPLRESAPARAFDMLICLLQTGESAKALKVLETYPQPFEPYV